MHRIIESTIQLPSGEVVTIRAARPEDAAAVKRFLEGLSEESRLLARQHGIGELVATVMTVKRPVLGLIDHIAPVRSSRFDGDAVEVVIPLHRATPITATA